MKDPDIKLELSTLAIRINNRITQLLIPLEARQLEKHYGISVTAKGKS